MNEIEFIKGLRGIPSKERVEFLKEKKFPKEFIMEYINNCFFREKTIVNEYGDPIKNLTLNYDGSTVKIGMITFDIEPTEDAEYFYFGRFETDLLAINKNLLIIEMLEYGTDNHVIYKCAQNSSSFLESILVSAIFMEKAAFDDNIYGNQRITCNVAEECGEIAGGAEFLGFYKMLVGCDS